MNIEVVFIRDFLLWLLLSQTGLQGVHQKPGGGGGSQDKRYSRSVKLWHCCYLLCLLPTDLNLCYDRKSTPQSITQMSGSRLLSLAVYPPGLLFPLGFVGVVWREDPPWIRPSGLFPAAQNVLQQRRYFSELLVARPRSVEASQTSLWCVRDDWEWMCGWSHKKKPRTKKVLVGTRL